MSARRRRLFVIAAAAAFCALAFYLAQTRTLEFAVASHFRAFLDGLPPPEHARYVAIMAHLPVDEDPAAWIVRKSVSIVFFGCVGALARFIAGDRVKTSVGGFLLTVGAAVAMSAAIEIYEFPESIGNEAFDIGCGLVGGLLAAGALRVFGRRGGVDPTG